MRNRRVDLLGEAADGRLIHIELQSTHERAMALRMAEYSLAIFRQFGRFPEQVVHYVGEARLRMEGRLSGPHFQFACRIADIREFDGEPLLDSEYLADNILAVLMRLRDRRDTVRRILERIQEREPAEREIAMAALLILAGLRKLGTVIEREVETMPILDDIMDHEVIGRERKRGMALGLEEGKRIAFRRETALITRQLEKRFGPLPGWATDRLQAMNPDSIEAVALRLFDAASLAELPG